jgi:hypothetical protein
MDFINKVPICEPIKNLTNKLLERRGKILRAELGDYHFHEVRIEMSSVDQEEFNTLVTQIEKIKIVDHKLCACDCH